MKKLRFLVVGIAVLALAMAFTGCGAKGGTITIINESDLTLSSVKISLGNSEVESMVPGQWMKASVDRNVGAANISFKLTKADVANLDIICKGEKISGTQIGIDPFPSRWTSSTIEVKDGDSVIVIISKKAPL